MIRLPYFVSCRRIGKLLSLTTSRQRPKTSMAETFCYCSKWSFMVNWNILDVLYYRIVPINLVATLCSFCSKYGFWTATKIRSIAVAVSRVFAWKVCAYQWRRKLFSFCSEWGYAGCGGSNRDSIIPAVAQNVWRFCGQPAKDSFGLSFALSGMHIFRQINNLSIWQR